MAYQLSSENWAIVQGSSICEAYGGTTAVKELDGRIGGRDCLLKMCGESTQFFVRVGFVRISCDLT